jgi:hypothetical protein
MERDPYSLTKIAISELVKSYEVLSVLFYDSWQFSWTTFVGNNETACLQSAFLQV